jgi:methyl-accepting chemotaxis protein
MSKSRRFPAWIAKTTLAGVLVCSAAGAALAGQDSTLFSYDGQDFVRTYTTLTEDGKSAVGTKLDHESAAYKALIKKHSYSGEITIFGKKCDASYAPLTDKSGKLTGAVFVCISK